MNDILFVLFLGVIITGNFPVFANGNKNQVIFKKEGDNLIVENFYYKATILPKKGGRIGSLILKSTNHELTGNKTNPGWGIGKDIEITQNWPGEMLNAPYQYKIDSPNSQTIIVNLSYQKGHSPQLKDIVLKKTYSFFSNTPVIKVEIKIKNKGASRNFGYRVHNDVIAGKEVDSHDIYFTPTASGIKGYYYKPGTYMIKDFTTGWAGVFDTITKEGIIFKLDKQSLDKFFFWMGKIKASNIEWFYKKVSLEKGDIWKTTYYIIPVDNISSIPFYVDEEKIIYTYYEGPPIVHLNIQGLIEKEIEIEGEILDKDHCVISRLESQRINLKPNSFTEIVYNIEKSTGGLNINLKEKEKTISIILPRKDTSVIVKPYDDPRLFRSVMATRINLQTLEEKIKTLSGKKKNLIKEKLEKLKEELSSLSITKKQISALTPKLNKISSQINQALFPDREYLIWFKNCWEDFLPYDIPELNTIDLEKIDVSLAKNEYESTAFMLTNTSNKDLTFKITTSKLRGIDIKLRSAFFVELAEGERPIIADALPSISLLEFPDQITVPLGQTAQIWLTIKSNKEIQPGIYKIKIKIQPLSKGISPKYLSLNLNVYPLTFPDKVTLHNHTSVYLVPKSISPRRWNLYDVKEEAIKDLVSHYNNYFTIHYSRSKPPFRCDKEGNIISIDFRSCDEAIKMYKDTKGVLIWVWELNKRNPCRYWAKLGGKTVKYPSPEWKKAFKNWLSQWVRHLKENGIGYDRFAMFPVDEVSFSEELLELFKTIKEVDPKIKTYLTTGIHYMSFEGMKQLIPYVDIWSLYGSLNGGEKVSFLKKAGKEVWDYNSPCACKRDLPYPSFRQIMWRIWDAELDGYNTWAYNHNGGGESLWDDFDGEYPDWTFVYDGKTAPFKTNEKIITSKRWEAWREGIEDHEFLCMLKRTIEEAKEKRVRQSIINRSKEVLRKEVNKVVSDSSDPTLADQSRKRIIEEIIELREFIELGG